MTGNTTTRELRIPVGERTGEVSAILMLPSDTRLLCVLAHGAGAGMKHKFMEHLSMALAARKIATLRYQFPYMEHGNKRPDVPAKLTATVRRAVDAAAEHAPGVPLIAGGKSLGGRMTSTAASTQPLPNVQGVVFFGFPLHAPNRPGNERAEHLFRVSVPMLFLQGTRDALANLDLLRPVCEKLGERARMHVVEGGDHSFAVLKRSGRTNEEVIVELADATDTWSTNF